MALKEFVVVKKKLASVPARKMYLVYNAVSVNLELLVCLLTMH